MNYITKATIPMVFMIICVLLCIGFLHSIIVHAALHNIWLNGLIFTVIIIGVILTFKQIWRLRFEQNWLNKINEGKMTYVTPEQLSILSPLALMIEENNMPTYIAPINAKTILSTIENRLTELRDVSSYCKGLLVFLGLLGTFWGLTQTVIGISGIIGTLDINGADAKHAFQTLKNGLNAPLTGMGTAFSCSMFGLAGSLIIGFLDLQVGLASSNFYNQLENQLATFTKFSPFGSGQDSQAGTSGSAFSYSLLEQAIEGMAALYENLKKSEDSRLTMTKSVQLFSEKLSEMSEYMMAHQGFSQRLAQHQIELQEALLDKSKDGSKGRTEEIIKTHIRSIDATLNKLLEEQIEGRQKSLQEIRQEIRFVTRTLSAIASGQDVSI